MRQNTYYPAGVLKNQYISIHCSEPDNCLSRKRLLSIWHNSFCYFEMWFLIPTLYAQLQLRLAKSVSLNVCAASRGHCHTGQYERSPRGFCQWFILNTLLLPASSWLCVYTISTHARRTAQLDICLSECKHLPLSGLCANTGTHV